MPEIQQNIPNPDPSDRSSAQVLREISILRELLETRLDANDEAQRVSETRYLRVPEEIRDAVKGLEDLMTEKFKGIDNRFSERDARVIQSDIDAKAAVKAALESAEKAVTKAESGMTKLTDSLAKRIDELRDSQKTNEGTKLGTSENKSDISSNRTLIIGLITLILGVAGTIVAAIGVAVAIIVAFHPTERGNSPPSVYLQQQPAQQQPAKQ